MKITSKVRIAAICGVAVSLASFGVAHADTTTITNTGPDSTNVVNMSTTVTHVVTNINTGTTTNSNVQNGTSGDAVNNDNTGAGGATSGNVNNSNSFSTTISINNSVPAPVPSNIAGGGSAAPSESKESGSATLPKTGGDGIDTSLFNALYNAPKGVFGPLPKAGSSAGWILTALAASLAVASGFAYDRYKQAKLAKVVL